jgi:hypothetical protein
MLARACGRAGFDACFLTLLGVKLTGGEWRVVGVKVGGGVEWGETHISR